MSMAFYFYIVAFGTVAAFCSYLASFRFIPVSAAVLLSSFEPLTAVLFGVVFMGLALSAAEAAGILCILAMTVLRRLKVRESVRRVGFGLAVVWLMFSPFLIMWKLPTRQRK